MFYFAPLPKILLSICYVETLPIEMSVRSRMEKKKKGKEIDETYS